MNSEKNDLVIAAKNAETMADAVIEAAMVAAGIDTNIVTVEQFRRAASEFVASSTKPND